MIGFHGFLGLAVVLLNGATGVRGLLYRSRGPVDPALAGWAHGTLGIQVASGFFLLTSTTQGIGLLHLALPTAALAGVLGARAVRDERKHLAVAVASLAAAGASLLAYFTGLLRG